MSSITGNVNITERQVLTIYQSEDGSTLTTDPSTLEVIVTEEDIITAPTTAKKKKKDDTLGRIKIDLISRIIKLYLGHIFIIP